jgi:UDP-3-O-[3-hydroxymyristoyl] glucosamine N-acyltransferase
VARIHALFLESPFVATGVHPQAVLGRECHIPREVSIGPFVCLGARVRLGERVTLHAGVVLYDDVEIGDDAVLHANVTVYQGCRIGARSIVHAGAVIGADGFGYAADERGRHLKRPQVGIVEIEADVEIGANAAIDRATFGRTLIRQGAKIDNLVQIGHNVEVGEDSLLVAQVGIAGSTTLGRGVVLGGQAGLGGHLRLGDRVMVAAKSGVHTSPEAGAVLAGIPAIGHRRWLRASTAYAQLPELVKELRALRKQVAALERAEAGGEESGHQGEDAP